MRNHLIFLCWCVIIVGVGCSIAAIASWYFQ
jgi:hypothetical protein